MPKVPQLDRQQQIAALPSARIGAAPTAETLGAGISQVGENVGLALFARAAREEDEAAFQHADLQMSKAQIDLQLKVEKLRGRDALGATELVETEWKDTVAHATENLTTDRQKRSVQRAAAGRHEQLYRIAQAHGFKEHEAWKDGEDLAYLQTSTDVARMSVSITDENLRAEAIQAEKIRQLGVLNNRAERKGLMGTETYNQQVASVMSNTNTEVVTGLLNNGMDISAKQYYDANKDQFTAKDRDRVEKAVVEGSTRGESRRMVQGWVEDGLDRKGMLAEAAKLADPKLADQVDTRVNHHWQEVDAIKKDQADQSYQAASRLIDKSTPGTLLRDIRGITEQQYLAMPAAERSALERRVDEHMKPTDRVNDDKTWLNFRDLDAAAVAKLTKAEFEVKYWQHFDNATRKVAVEKWDASREAAAKGTDLKLASTLSFEKQVDNTYRSSGLVDPNKKHTNYNDREVLAFARFEREAAAAVEEYQLTQLQGKRKASPTEIQTVIDGVKDQAIQQVFVRRGAFSSDATKLIDVAEEERGKVYVPMTKIPKADTDEISNYITSLGKKPTRDKIQRIAGQQQLGEGGGAKEQAAARRLIRQIAME